MKINIEPKAVVVATMDKEKFEQSMKKDFNLKQTIDTNLEIVYNETNESTTDIKDLFLLYTDWGQIIELFQTGPNIMKFYLYKCHLKGLHAYKPNEVVAKSVEQLPNNEVSFKEEVIDVDDYMVVHSFIPLLEQHIETVINNFVFTYAREEFKKVFEL